MTSRPAWHPDPTGRFEQRYWDGAMWTDHVWARGQQGVDPLIPTAEAARPAMVAAAPNDPATRYTPPPAPALERRAFPPGWSQKKREKMTAEASRYLFPGENVLYQGNGGTWRPLANDLVVTDLRVFSFGVNGIGISVETQDLIAAEADANRGAVTLTDTSGIPKVFSSISPKDVADVHTAVEAARASDPSPEARGAVRAAAIRDAEELRLADLTIRERWPATMIYGDVSRKSETAIRALCARDEAPWLVIAPGFAQGVLAAFDDRLAIIKTGAMTSLMAGSLGGERSTTFYFADVNAIEYNSGFMNGVLEVLTASYQGTANKDFWRGTDQSRNADSNDPYTLSNTLPMAKVVYRECAPQIQELRARISGAKRPAPVVISAPAAAVAPGLGDQLEKLAALRAAGALTEEEFMAAKARLMAG
ncbi:DUF2510 domain-containing protein [Microbacterium sp.]|uniref:DUF2510 domain-containing protein n=1 Tax=Microbacterium sp. TaxID=51671 RepID=UPI00334277F7